MNRVGLLWLRIPENARRSLEKSLLEIMDNFNDDSLVFWLKKCTGIGYNWSKNPQVRKAFCRGIVSLYGEKNVLKGEPTLFTSIVKLFGEKMNGVDIPEIVLTSFYNGIERLSAQFNSGGLADVIAGYEHSSEFTFLFDFYSFLWT
jgi:hypothetical protein